MRPRARLGASGAECRRGLLGRGHAAQTAAVRLHACGQHRTFSAAEAKIPDGPYASVGEGLLNRIRKQLKTCLGRYNSPCVPRAFCSDAVIGEARTDKSAAGALQLPPRSLNSASAVTQHTDSVLACRARQQPLREYKSLSDSREVAHQLKASNREQGCPRPARDLPCKRRNN